MHVARTCLLMALAYATHRGFFLEQPGSSMMLQTAAMEWIKKCAELTGASFDIIDTFMGAFASEHLKPTMLVSNRYAVHSLKKKKPRGMSSQTVVTKSTRADGKRQCTGKHKELKGTQQYTEEFGLGVAMAIRDSSECLDYVATAKLPIVATAKLPSWDDDDYDAEENPWHDLELEPCLDYLLTEQRAIAPLQSNGRCVIEWRPLP